MIYWEKPRDVKAQRQNFVFCEQYFKVLRNPCSCVRNSRYSGRVASHKVKTVFGFDSARMKTHSFPQLQALQLAEGAVIETWHSKITNWDATSYSCFVLFCFSLCYTERPRKTGEKQRWKRAIMSNSGMNSKNTNWKITTLNYKCYLQAWQPLKIDVQCTTC